MISYNDLKEEDFILPQPPQPFLPGIKNKKPQIYLGLPGWGYKTEMKKKNDPHPQPGTLGFYATCFNATELINCFDEIPHADKVAKWYKAVEGIDFKFCPLFYKGITKGIIDIQRSGLTKDFLNKISGLKEKLGPCLLTLPETLTYENAGSLTRYLETISKEHKVFAEVNHASWFADHEWLASFAARLNYLGKGFAINDSPEKREAVHMHLSSATAYIRFFGEGWNETDLFRISQWKKVLHSWFLQGLESCYFFFYINKKGQDDFLSYVHEEFQF